MTGLIYVFLNLAHASPPFAGSVCAGLLTAADAVELRAHAAPGELSFGTSERARAIAFLADAASVTRRIQRKAERDLWAVRFAAWPLLKEPSVAWYHRLRDGQSTPRDARALDGALGLASVAAGLGLLVVDNPVLHADFFGRFITQRDHRVMAELGLIAECLRQNYPGDHHVTREFRLLARDPRALNATTEAAHQLSSAYSRLRRGCLPADVRGRTNTWAMDLRVSAAGELSLNLRRPDVVPPR